MKQVRATSAAQRLDTRQRWLRWSLAGLLLAGSAWFATTADAAERLRHAMQPAAAASPCGSV